MFHKIFHKKSIQVVTLIVVALVGMKVVLLSGQKIQGDKVLAEITATSSVPTVGAIRWDAWYTGGPGATDEIALTPSEWHDRIPFYAQFVASTTASTTDLHIRVDTQEVMDQEIAAAKAGGLDYWAFDYYGNANSITGALNKYMASAQKADMKFSLLVLPQATTASDWPASAVQYFQDSQYVKVVNGRPLVYAFAAGSPITKASMDSLRAAAQAAGLPNPYIVWMTWNVNDGKVAELGLDAVSAYALAPTGTAETVQPYSNLVNVDEQFWNTAKTLGLKTVPIVTTGWDPRPCYAYPPPWGEGNHTAVAVGTASEIASHLQSAFTWIDSNTPVSEPRTIIMYAWNEYAEGGWLAPLLQTGAERLNAINQVITAVKSDTPPQVSIQSPIASSTISGAVSITANATDNAGIAGVQFVLDGANLGTEITTAPYTLSWDTMTVTNSTHTLSAVARDTTGHITTSAPVAVSVNNTTLPQQPVGMWNLNQSIGTTTTDTSGNNYNGTLVGGASWTLAKNGNGLNLNGVDGYASIPDNILLDKTKAITLSAWVNLAQLPSQNYVVVGKESNGVSYRFTVGSNGKISFTVATANNAWYSPGTTATSLTSLPVNAWKHVVGTYDGNYVRIYVNGVLEGTGSQPISGIISDSASALRFGYKSSANIDYTKGMIDEVSQYSVAFNAAEVKTLYDNVNNNADIIAPTVSITSPLNNALVSRNTTVTIQANATDTNGISKVEFLVNGVVKCTDTASPYTCAWLVPSSKGVVYTLNTKAYDMVGNTASSTVKVTSK